MFTLADRLHKQLFFLGKGLTLLNLIEVHFLILNLRLRKLKVENKKKLNRIGVTWSYEFT